MESHRASRARCDRFASFFIHYLEIRDTQAEYYVPLIVILSAAELAGKHTAFVSCSKPADDACRSKYRGTSIIFELYSIVNEELLANS